MLNIKNRQPWKLIEFPTFELAMLKISYSVESTATRPLKVSVIVHRHGIEIIRGPLTEGQIFEDDRISWIPASDVSLKQISKYVTLDEAIETIAIFKNRRNDLMRIVPKVRDYAQFASTT